MKWIKILYRWRLLRKDFDNNFFQDLFKNLSAFIRCIVGTPLGHLCKFCNRLRCLRKKSNKRTLSVARKDTALPTRAVKELETGESKVKDQNYSIRSLKSFRLQWAIQGWCTYSLRVFVVVEKRKRNGFLPSDIRVIQTVR